MAPNKKKKRGKRESEKVGVKIIFFLCVLVMGDARLICQGVSRFGFPGLVGLPVSL